MYDEARPGSGGCVGLADHDGHDILEPLQQARDVTVNEPSSVGGDDLVVRAREAAPAAADGQRGGAAVQAAELDVDQQPGHRTRERGVDLADEGRVGDVGILVADDARVVGRRWASSRRS